jgi:two-component system, chemotaxis family, CheB/CheR fusion protein
VGIGASAGGLEACRKLVSALPVGNGMAFILVQHLDPSHASMMVDLLGGHTRMPVLQAVEGMRLEPDHFYVIPPGVYLSVKGGALHLSQPLAPHGARLPFDFLLGSIARAYRARVVCVILSGTGADGSLGLGVVKAHGGYVIAQDPGEADYDGMPRSAITTGAVDSVLRIAVMAGAIVANGRGDANPKAVDQATGNRVGQILPQIIELLRANTVHDFTLYKPGTLERRIERRMAVGSIGAIDHYLKTLRSDPNELDRLAKDLLINVTGFFRDSTVFDLLAEAIIPPLVRDHSPDRPLRIWIAGCSSGEETYSLAMLFREQIVASRRDIKLQVFASDVDPDAIASAREGFYLVSIEADVSPGRLARFFAKEQAGYRVLPELRSCVVFTVQDLLADPPFSRLDFVSCRNLLIYLKLEAQAKVVSIFHFALREGGFCSLATLKP